MRIKFEKLNYMRVVHGCSERVRLLIIHFKLEKSGCTLTWTITVMLCPEGWIQSCVALVYRSIEIGERSQTLEILHAVLEVPTKCILAELLLAKLQLVRDTTSLSCALAFLAKRSQLAFLPVDKREMHYQT